MSPALLRLLVLPVSFVAVVLITPHPGPSARAGLPDTNGKIAFSMYERGPGTWDIYVVNPDGTGLTMLTGTGDAFSPAWSPDGTKIVFHRRDLGIFIMDDDGSHVRRVIRDGIQPAWSPEGDRIAFARPGDPYDIMIVNADGDGAEGLGTGGGDSPAWSPDGATILYDHEGAVFSIRPDGSHLRRLAQGYAPDWSPRGGRIAFVQIFYDPTVDDYLGNVMVMAADGTHIRQLTFSKHRDEFNPAWSPDGRRITFEGSPSFFTNYNLYVMDADGTQWKEYAFSGSVYDPDWQPIP